MFLHFSVIEKNFENKFDFNRLCFIFQNHFSIKYFGTTKKIPCVHYNQRKRPMVTMQFILSSVKQSKCKNTTYQKTETLFLYFNCYFMLF